MTSPDLDEEVRITLRDAAQLIGFLSDELGKDGNQVWNVYAAEPGQQEGLAGGARRPERGAR